MLSLILQTRTLYRERFNNLHNGPLKVAPETKLRPVLLWPSPGIRPWKGQQTAFWSPILAYYYHDILPLRETS